ncbi:MAG: deoxyribonuclease IV [Armatimonadetes bacterium]|nr:deoxyribonuclease IV [Armatimonadota bacterium]
MTQRLIGAHMPTKGGLGEAVRNGKKIGCTAVQVFTSSPQQWRAKPITDEMVADFKAAKEATGIDCVVSHDSYLVNLCAELPEKKQQSREGLKAEIERCHQYGIRWCVSHIGAHTGRGVETGLKESAESLLWVFENSPDDVMVLAETTAGQGSCLNSKFEEISEFFELCKGHPRLGVCLDTCHIFAAGYPISAPEEFTQTFNMFDQLIGISNLKCIHVNDSKKPLGSRVDRHDHIGEGEIGRSAFMNLMADTRLAHIPMIVETPDAEENHERNVKSLFEMVKSNSNG